MTEILAPGRASFRANPGTVPFVDCFIQRSLLELRQFHNASRETLAA
jgi:hypothetical protein